MNYQKSINGVGKRRALLKAALEQANDLRREAGLPLRDVDRVVTETEPLLTQQQFDDRAKAQAGFNRFRRERLAQVNLPKPTDWQQRRALTFRQMFLEHEAIVAWHDQATGGGLARQ